MNLVGKLKVIDPTSACLPDDSALSIRLIITADCHEMLSAASSDRKNGPHSHRG